MSCTNCNSLFEIAPLNPCNESIATLPPTVLNNSASGHFENLNLNQTLYLFLQQWF